MRKTFPSSKSTLTTRIYLVCKLALTSDIALSDSVTRQRTARIAASSKTRPKLTSVVSHSLDNVDGARFTVVPALALARVPYAGS